MVKRKEEKKTPRKTLFRKWELRGSEGKKKEREESEKETENEREEMRERDRER